MEFKILNMDVMQGLSQLEENSIDCVVTSPPYFGLRDYGVENQIGLESYPQEWIDKMVNVFREIKKVLKPTGNVWLNVGDSYENKQLMLMPSRLAIAMQEDGWICRNSVIWHKPSHMPSSVKDRLTNSFEHLFHFVQQRKYYYDLDAIREPHANMGKSEGIAKGKRFGGKSQATVPVSGFGERELFNNPSGKNPADVWKGESDADSDLIRGKDNGSVKQVVHRPQNFENITEQIKDDKYGEDAGNRARTETRLRMGLVEQNPLGKNPSDFWSINPQPFPEAHFAVFPEALVERPLKATVPKQICTKCGTARERITKVLEREKAGGAIKLDIAINRHIKRKNLTQPTKIETLGFTSCPCKADFKAGTVLDPFLGSGTTLVVAKRLKLNGIGIELKEEYCQMAYRRLLERLKHEKEQQYLGEPSNVQIIKEA